MCPGTLETKMLTAVYDSLSEDAFDQLKVKYKAFDAETGKYLRIAGLTSTSADVTEYVPCGKRLKVIYHDPCFLGKRNGIFDEPRHVIESIPGVELLEFERNRTRSLCCEGGGGRMWVDVPGEKLAERRAREAAEAGADVIAVACPFCLVTLEDAVKTTGLEERLKVMDIAELLLASIRGPSGAS